MGWRDPGWWLRTPPSLDRCWARAWHVSAVRKLVRFFDRMQASGLGPDPQGGSPGKFPTSRWYSDDDYRNPHFFDERDG